MKNFRTLTCQACHDTKNSNHPYFLVEDPEKLCNYCHTPEAVLRGQGAAGIEETRSVHSAVPCVSCHMTGKNHRMKVIRPDDPELSEKQDDTCTACHKDNNRITRARQPRDWRSNYRKTMEKLQQEIKNIESMLKTRPGSQSHELSARFKNLRANLEILEKDKSRGAHNLDYALEITSLAARDLRDIRLALEK